MEKKNKKHSEKSEKKQLLKNIEIKLTEAVNDFHRKISVKKLEKKIHKAGKILSRSLTMEKIKVVHKEQPKTPKKNKKTRERENEAAT
jgi:hypothetical protein